MNENSLRGQTALITGSARRLGRAIALALAEEGVNIIAHYHTSTKEADGLCRELVQAGVKAWKLRADLEDATECHTLVQRAREMAGPVAILINNASIFPAGNFEETTLEDIHRNLQVNAWAPLVLSREFARQTSHGKIVNLLDTRVNGYDPLHVAYHLSKQMLAALTRVTALELAPGIAVNAVAPGLILPPEGEDEAYLDRVAASLPLRTHGSPQDVADAVLFLLKSKFLTGQIIYVDGGRHLRMENGEW